MQHAQLFVSLRKGNLMYMKPASARNIEHFTPVLLSKISGTQRGKRTRKCQADAGVLFRRVPVTTTAVRDVIN
jgi:hypothetical protein